MNHEIIITERFLNRGKSSKGGWNNAQMKRLGVTSFKKGWRKNLLGTVVSTKQANEFLSLKNAHINNGEPIEFDRSTPFEEQYKHPLWQKKRLGILKRDKWRCRICNNGALTLHVHHRSYANEGMVWEISPKELVTLCSKCHSLYHGKQAL